MKPKIVFFDIDGTLLDHQKKLPKSTKEAINKLQSSGILTAIATGRAPYMYQDLRETLGVTTFLSFNGQYVRVGEEEVFKNPFKREDLDHLHQVAEQNGHPLAYLGSHEMGATHDQHPFILRSFESLKQPFPAYHPSFFEENDIYQALLFFEKAGRPNYLDTHQAFDTIQWHEHSMDVIPKGGSKANGIQAVLNYLGIDPKEAVAFGDGLNDVEMLSFVGTGIAMGNAVEEAKKAAHMVAQSVDQDGIALALKQMGWMN